MRKIFWDTFYMIIFLLGYIYLIGYNYNLKKAAEITGEAIFPIQKHEYDSILIPAEWKQMKPLSKNTKSYKLAKSTSFAVLGLFAVFFWMVITTDIFAPAFLNLAYVFYSTISLIKHQGNLYILPKGIILNGKYYSFHRLKHYETEKIVRWHQLYGLDDRVNNAYKLTIKIKGAIIQPNFVVIEDIEHLKTIVSLLDRYGIKGYQKTEFQS